MLLLSFILYMFLCTVSSWCSCNTIGSIAFMNWQACSISEFENSYVTVCYHMCEMPGMFMRCKHSRTLIYQACIHGCLTWCCWSRLPARLKVKTTFLTGGRCCNVSGPVMWQIRYMEVMFLFFGTWLFDKTLLLFHIKNNLIFAVLL